MEVATDTAFTDVIYTATTDADDSQHQMTESLTDNTELFWRVTTQNIKIVAIREEDNAILVKGSIPGGANGYVTVRAAIKFNHL